MDFGSIDWPVLAGQIGLGVILGFAIGFTMKKALKVGLIILGLGTLILLALQQVGFVSIDWVRIESAYQSSLQQAGGLQSVLQGWLSSLEALLPVAGSFTAGFFLGFRQA